MSAAALPIANRAYARSDNDWYVEPAWAVAALLRNETFQGMIYDPACGCGTIPRSCREAGLAAFGSDIEDRGFGIVRDFLTYPALSFKRDNIICNPPYGAAEAFLEKALAETRFKVAFLLRLSFLESRRRKVLFERTPLARVLVFSDRVSMPPGGTEIEAKGGAVAFAWFVWDHSHSGPATLGWLTRAP